MHQAKCVAFLKWAMPRLGLVWAGFAHCHRQVCKRLNKRIAELGLSSFAAYRDYTLDHDTEWEMIDACCRVTVSRLYRDKDVFDRLASEILPRLAADARARGDTVLRAWSAGCGAGEEPFSLTLAWRFGAASRFPDLTLEIAATDIDDAQLARARGGCYRLSSLREVPLAWAKTAFVSSGPLRCLRPEYRQGVDFSRQDIRADAPKGPFDLVLCRNLAFTYFDAAQQREVLAVILRELAPDGALVIGRREHLPEDARALTAWVPHLRIFRNAASTRPGATAPATPTARLG
jgi:chemotaxis protein methyltransferase CheR